MKKIMIGTLAVLCIVLCASAVPAQPRMIDYTWASYGIGFSIPQNFDVIINTNNEFTAGTDSFAMSIKPWSDAEITDPVDVALAAYQITAGTNKRIIKEIPLENLNGLRGHVAYVTADQDAGFSHIVIGGFIVLSSDTNFTVQILWYDSPRNEYYIDTAVSILQSFIAL